MRLRPERLTLAVVLIMFLGSLPLALSSVFLAPALLVPIGTLVWVLRARVVATPAEVEVCNGLAVRRVAWADVAGFRVPDHGPVRLLRDGAAPLPLTGMSRRDLPKLMAVSQP